MQAYSEAMTETHLEPSTPNFIHCLFSSLFASYKDGDNNG